MQGEVLRQTGLRPQVGESLVHLLGRHPLPTLSQPQLLTAAGTQKRPGLIDPLAQSVDHPVELGNGQHRATPRALPRLDLAYRTWTAPNVPHAGIRGLGRRSATSR